MSEEATKLDAGDVSSATPASAESTTESTGAQPQPQTDPGHVAGSDFDDPRWGPKLRNLSKGIEEKGRALNETKAEKEKLAQTVTQWQAFLANNPDLSQAIRDRVEGKAATPSRETPQEDESDEDRKLRELKEQIKADLEAEQALSNTMIHLGKGDPYEGRKIWETQWQPKVREIVNTFVDGGPDQKIALALELLRLREAANQKAPAAPVIPPAGGTTNADMTRGTGDRAPIKEPETDEEIISDGLRRAGFKNALDYLEKSGALGD